MSLSLDSWIAGRFFTPELLRKPPYIYKYPFFFKLFSHLLQHIAQSYCWLCILSWSLLTLITGFSRKEKSLKTLSLPFYIILPRMGTRAIKMFCLASQVEAINSQSLQTSLLFHLSPVSLRILSYLARWSSIPLKMMELDSLSNAWNLYTLRSTVTFNQILGHKINSSTFGTKADFWHFKSELK